MRFTCKSLVCLFFGLLLSIPQFDASLTSAAGKKDLQSETNLRTCLSGKYPGLCNHELLSSNELKMTLAAERRENLNICLSGGYPLLCDHSKLTESEREQALEAEKRENLRICLTGQYPTLCNRSLLSQAELSSTMAAEKSENLKICLSGRYPSLCNHSLLTPQELKETTDAEREVAQTLQSAQRPGQSLSAGDCESGHWIESVSDNGEIIKLEDGSIWQVDPLDTIDSSLWLPISEVVACNNLLINSDEGETVHATPIGGGVISHQPLKTPSGPAQISSYEVEASADDETFVINAEIFTAKTYCFNVEKGDRVIFISGDAHGTCVSAEFFNLRTNQICRVWCE